MGRLALALLATLWLAAPAWAEVCTFSTSGDWGPVTTYTGTDDCTLDAGDSVVIQDGVTVTVIADVTQNSTAGAGITVETGGTLDVSSENMGTPAALNLTLGPAGLTTETGSTLILHGGFRDYTDGSFMTTPDFDDLWYVGSVIPCAGLIDDDGVNGGDVFWEPDCNAACGAGGCAGGINTDEVAGDASKVMIAYQNEIFNGKSLSTINTAIGAMSAASEKEDVVYFVRAGSGRQVPAELWYGYEVASADDSDSRMNQYFELAIRQGDREHTATAAACTGPSQIGVDIDGYDWDSRDVDQATLSAATTRGSRTFTVPEGVGAEPSITACGGVDYEHIGDDYVGQWARFMSPAASPLCGDDLGDGPCEPANTPIRIMRFEENGASANTLTVGDVSGLPSDYASGSTVLLRSYGFQRGDPFVVWIPVRVLSATNAATDTTDSPLSLNGSTTAVSVVIDGIGGSTTAINTDTGFRTVDWDYVWIKDGGAQRNFWEVDAMAADQSLLFKHTFITPGDTGRGDTTDRNDHFMIVGNSSEPAGSRIEFRQFASRYYEDDNFGSTNNLSQLTFHIEGGRFQFPSGGGASYGAFEFQSAELMTATSRDIECIDCTHDSAAVNGVDSTDGMLVWGSRCLATKGITNKAAFVGTDITIIGGENWAPNCAAMSISATNFLVRDHFFVNDSVSGYWTVVGKNGLFLNNVAPRSAGFFAEANHSMENVAVVNSSTFDMNSSGCDNFQDCTVFNWSHIASQGIDATFKNMSVIFTDDYDPPDFDLRSTDATVDPGALTGFKFNAFAQGTTSNDGNIVRLQDTLWMGLRGRRCSPANTHADCVDLVMNTLTADDDGGGVNQTDDGQVWSGGACFFSNREWLTFGADVAATFTNPWTEIGTDGATRNDSFPPGFPHELERQLEINRDGRLGQLGCGHKASPPPGVRKYRLYHALSKIHPENAATIGLSGGGGGGGQAPRTY